MIATPNTRGERKLPTAKPQSLFNVWAVVGGQPIAKQNKKPMTVDKADALVERLLKGESKAIKAYRVRV